MLPRKSHSKTAHISAQMQVTDGGSFFLCAVDVLRLSHKSPSSRATKGSVAISAAELFTTAVDYPYSSAGNWLGEGKGLVEIDKDFSW